MTPTARAQVALVLFLAVAAALAQAAPPPEAAARYAQGEDALRRGEVEAAAEAFLEAARAAPKEAEYVQRATLLRRIVSLRRLVEARPDDPTWDRSVTALHAFYLENGLAALAVEIDAKAHARAPGPDSALRLAEAHLAAGQNAEAANTAAAYSASSPRLAAVHGIALARLGMKEAAAGVADRMPAPASDAAPAEAFDRARLSALLGRADAACAMVALALERTPPSGAEALRARIRAEKDFAALAAQPSFAKALATASKVEETCSGGSSCSSCPNRGSCRGAKR